MSALYTLGVWKNLSIYCLLVHSHLMKNHNAHVRNQIIVISENFNSLCERES